MKIIDVKWFTARSDCIGIVLLSIDGEVCTIALARITCYLIYGEPPDESYVADHIDGNTMNNYYTNLRWATYSENLRGAKAYEEKP